MKYIDKIGYEIEGLWWDNCYDLESILGGSFTDDGSLYFNERDIEDIEMSNSKNKKNVVYHSKLIEYRSRPRSKLSTIKKDIATIKKYFITGNSTCGFHIHFSFKRPEITSLLVSRTFEDCFLNTISARFTKMYNERKDNSYCMTDRLLNKDRVLRGFFNGLGDRYRAVNYNSFKKHGTIEIRLFDMLDIENCFSYIRFSADTIEKYLQKAIKEKVENRIERPNKIVKEITLRDNLKLKQNTCVK